MNAKQILDREFLEIRARLLDVAAAMDRLDRAQGDVRDDVQWQRLRDAVSIIAADQETATRAEQIQQLFSRQYDQQWRDKFEMTARSS